jgi:hypothetical protein
MLLIHPVQELPRALPALLGLLVAGSSRGNGELWSLVGFGVVVALGMLRWLTTSYRITAEQVQVRRGLLRRQVLSVPRDRVRTVDVTAHVLHRLVGLTRVPVGTGRCAWTGWERPRPRGCARSCCTATAPRRRRRPRRGRTWSRPRPSWRACGPGGSGMAPSRSRGSSPSAWSPASCRR